MPAVLDRPRTGPPPGAPPPAGGGTAGAAPSAEVGGAWPRTNRFLPWLIAAFLVMVWLVPFDSMQLRIETPVDAKLDRLVVGVMAMLWVASVLAGGRLSPRWWRDPLEALVIAFVVLAIASVVLNGVVLSRQGQVDDAIKKLALLASYASVFFIIATTVRTPEVPRLLRLFHLLALFAAGLVLLQYFTGRNLFFEFFQAVVPAGVFDFRPIGGQGRFVAAPITGPTRHALALAAMFAMALSVGLVHLLRARSVRDKVLEGLALVVILGAIFATSRKTGTFAGAAVVLTLTALRPRQMLRLLPAAAIVFALLTIYTPQAVETQLRQIEPGTITAGASGEARSADYEAIVPDVRQHPVTGRGFGTYDPHRFRVLDNNYLGLLLETGFLGLAAFVAMVLAVPWRARRLVRAGDPLTAPLGLAAAGAAAAIAAAMALFDAFSFAQVPYMFFFFAALVVVSRAEGARAPVPGRHAPPAPRTGPTDPPAPDQAARVSAREAAHRGGRLRERRLRPRRPGAPAAPRRDPLAAEPPARPVPARSTDDAPPAKQGGTRRAARWGAGLLAVLGAVAVLAQGQAPRNEHPPLLTPQGGDAGDEGFFAASEDGRPSEPDRRPRRTVAADRSDAPSTTPGGTAAGRAERTPVRSDGAPRRESRTRARRPSRGTVPPAASGGDQAGAPAPAPSAPAGDAGSPQAPPPPERCTEETTAEILRAAGLEPCPRDRLLLAAGLLDAQRRGAIGSAERAHVLRALADHPVRTIQNAPGPQPGR